MPWIIEQFYRRVYNCSTNWHLPLNVSTLVLLLRSLYGGLVAGSWIQVGVQVPQGWEVLDQGSDGLRGYGYERCLVMNHRFSRHDSTHQKGGRLRKSGFRLSEAGWKRTDPLWGTWCWTLRCGESHLNAELHLQRWFRQDSGNLFGTTRFDPSVFVVLRMLSSKFWTLLSTRFSIKAPADTGYSQLAGPVWHSLIQNRDKGSKES